MKSNKQIFQYCYATEQTCYNTIDMVNYIINNNIQGDIIECGVGGGGQIALIKSALANRNETRNIIAFDSYEGIPFGIEAKDKEQAGIGKMDGMDGRLESTGITVHSLENVISNITECVGNVNDITFVKGWFQNTLPEYKPNKIALLRLDGDLYESTMVCLNHLFSSVAKGGVVIIDDYGLYGCKLACDEFFKSIKYKPKYIAIDGSTSKYFIK
jgi:O-methyltransferase